MTHEQRLVEISTMTLDEAYAFRGKVSLSNLTSEKKEILYSAIDARIAKHDLNTVLVETNFEMDYE